MNIWEKKVGLDTLTVQYHGATMSIPHLPSPFLRKARPEMAGTGGLSLCVVEIAKEEHQLAPPLFVGPEVSSPDNRLKLTPFSFKRPANADQTSPGPVSGEEPPDQKKERDYTEVQCHVLFYIWAKGKCV
ncbi:MAG: hypothetical protein MUP21_10080 [Dehalococcoidia bacterium]|nr:hypothetical protein [Dehalococcoidia bacterium]